MILLFCLANFEYHHLHPLKQKCAGGDLLPNFGGAATDLEKNSRSGEVKTTTNAELSQYSMSSDGSDPPSLLKANEISSEEAQHHS